MHGDPRVRLEREPAVPRDVVGVRVRLQHPLDAHAAAGRLFEVGLDRVGRIDDDGDTRVLVADEVGAATETLVHELPEEHEATLPPSSASFLEACGDPPNGWARRTAR